MNIRESTRQNLIALSANLAEVAACEEEQPSVVAWAQKKRDLLRNVIFLNELLIPEVTDPKPGYTSGNGTTPAQYVPRPTDLEVKPDESTTSVPFIPARVDRP